MCVLNVFNNIEHVIAPCTLKYNPLVLLLADNCKPILDDVIGLCKFVNAAPSPPKLDAVTLAWKLGVLKLKSYAGNVVVTLPL